MKTVLMALLTLGSLTAFASPGDLECDFHFRSSLENKTERFSKVIPLDSGVNVIQLGSIVVGVSAELPKSPNLAGFLTQVSVAFAPSEKTLETSSAQSVFVADIDFLPVYFMYSQASKAFTEGVESYSVGCRRLKE